MNYWKSVTILTLFGLATAVAAISGAESHRPLIEKSHVDNSGTAITPEGKVRIDLREVQTEIQGAKGPMALSVLVLFDPASGAFSWRAYLANLDDPSWRSKQLNEEQAVFLKDDGFTDFMALPSPLRLFVRPYRGHASNMNDATENSLAAAGKSIDPLGDLQTSQGAHVVSLLAVGRDFTSVPPSDLEMFPKVTDVKWDGKDWIVTLEARWKEAVTLDANYNVVSAAKVDDR